jgi:hypothetical protein
LAISGGSNRIRQPRANVTAHDIGGALAPFRYREEPLTDLAWRAALPLTALVAVASALGLVFLRSSQRWRL